MGSAWRLNDVVVRLSRGCREMVNVELVVVDMCCSPHYGVYVHDIVVTFTP
jgi:hypothetical protein